MMLVTLPRCHTATTTATLPAMFKCVWAQDMPIAQPVPFAAGDSLDGRAPAAAARYAGQRRPGLMMLSLLGCWSRLFS